MISAAAAGLLAVPLPSAGAAQAGAVHQAGAARLAGAAGPVSATAHTSTIAKAALAGDPASLVNPFIGTTNAADDFPGADVPFGMVQWSPDTPSRPDGGGYEYNDSSITGFSLTHIAGPGCGAEGDIPVLPTVGAVSGSATGSFSHSNESASAGNYKVTLANGVTTELTATTRTGMADFTFPASSAANLIFKLDDSQNGDSATSFGVVSSTEVQGSATSGNFCGAGNTYTVYFDMQFSQPFSSSGTLSSTGAAAGIRQVSGSATEKPNHPVYHGTRNKGIAKSGASSADPAQSRPALTGPAGSYLTFNTSSNQTVLAKVGVSYVSAANAKSNLTSENSGWNFAATQSAAHSAWNTVLSRIGISGGTGAQQAEFYTALYHSLLHPNVFSDDNGQYQGPTGGYTPSAPGTRRSTRTSRAGTSTGPRPSRTGLSGCWAAAWTSPAVGHQRHPDRPVLLYRLGQPAMEGHLIRAADQPAVRAVPGRPVVVHHVRHPASAVGLRQQQRSGLAPAHLT